MPPEKCLIRLVLAMAALVGGQASAQVSVYLSPSGIETAEDSGIFGITPEQILTENFNALAAGGLASFTSTLNGATYSSGGRINANDVFSGYNEGNYLAIQQNRHLEITFAPAQYFGFNFTAIDASNEIKIYSGNTLLVDLTGAAFLNLLPNSPGTTIDAINGTPYATAGYYGQPVTGGNETEAYLYLHFIAPGTTTFDRVVFSAGGPTLNFESDNHSILQTAPSIPGTLVHLPCVPEPSSGLLAGVALAAALLRRRRFHAGS